jgi:barstar (barnase inhibitor)
VTSVAGLPGLRGLLATGLRPGVYRWHSGDEPDAVRRDAETAGWGFVLLDTSAAADKAGFLDVCATAFDLARWFGRTWDALADALGDRSTGEPEIVLWDGWQQLATGDLDALDVAVQIFTEDAHGTGQLRVLLHDRSATDVPPSPVADLPTV